jgi:hypothetical protein
MECPTKRLVARIMTQALIHGSATIAGVLAVPAKADETLKWRYFATINANQNHEVGDVPGHFVGWSGYSGLAELPDGSVAVMSTI